MPQSGNTRFLRPELHGDSVKKILDLEKILEVSKAMTAIHELDELLRYIMDATRELLDCDRCTIFLVDFKTNELFCRAVHGSEMREIRFPVGRGIAGHVAQSGEITNISDAYADSRFNPDVDKKTGYHTRNILTIPLRNFENKVVGVMQTLNKAGGPFLQYDETLLTALGSNAAIALEKAMLVEVMLEKQKLEQSLEIARIIQQSLLPDKPPVFDGAELAGFSEACDETGGDYFDYFPLKDGKIGIVVGDVSGHGIGSALLMATARAFLLALVSGENLQLGAIFHQFNNFLENDMEDGKFMTMFMGVYDPAAGEISYVSCGHDEPMHYHAATGEFTDYGSTGMPLGVMSDMEFEVAGPHKLEPGDALVITTDGVFEAPNEVNDRYGKERQQTIIREHHRKSAQEIVDETLRSVKAFIGKAPRKDDITLVVLKKF